ncbi:hypothetical protein [Rhizobium herbae]|uniref:Uncharacterized protein n=1 Tax=Rhizobium herbae TaxID=508661 RepID=A0ABS4EW20_9HYPH|nr:hypothetical protein [Rhizobium herbae]MBP1862166.1 hypothetical protein [Rhizobium herbae]
MLSDLLTMLRDQIAQYRHDGVMATADQIVTLAAVLTYAANQAALMERRAAAIADRDSNVVALPNRNTSQQGPKK